MRKPVHLVGGHIVDSRQVEAGQTVLRRKPVVGEIVIEEGLLMMSALMDGGLMDASGCEIEAT